MTSYTEDILLWKKLGKQLDAISDFIEGLNSVLAEANIYEPSERGAGYAVEFDENSVASLLKKFNQDYEKD